MVEIVNRLVLVETRKIKPYHRNPRRNDATVDKLVELIPKVGFNVPLVLDRNNVIVKGHTRWKAAVKLGMAQIPCVYTDADEETIKLDRLADNRVQEFSLWNDELLRGELASLNLDFAFDLGTLNFELADNRRRPPGGGADQSAGRESGEERSPPTGREGSGDDGTGEPFISEEDVRGTASLPVSEYDEVTCNKCGNRMYVRKRV
jgi:ParB family transcriptional regulator, chromosome partitioning protein